MSPREPQHELLHSQSSDSLTTVDEPKPQTPITLEHQATRVIFSTVQFRTYNRIVGDHPDPIGPPLSLDWEYIEHDVVRLDEYENNRPPKKRILRLSSITRKNILRNVFEVADEDILSAEKEIQKIRKQRENTSRRVKSGVKAESALKQARKRIFGRFSRENVIKALAAASGTALWIHAST